MNRLALTFGCLISYIGFAAAEDNTVAQQHESVVHSYISAFNAQDAEAMLTRVTDDVQWLSVDGDKISVETSSKKELRESLVEYFESCQSCQSKIAKIYSTGKRVSVLEVASYSTSGGQHEQQSVSIYEFSGALIQQSAWIAFLARDSTMTENREGLIWTLARGLANDLES